MSSNAAVTTVALNAQLRARFLGQEPRLALRAAERPRSQRASTASVVELSITVSVATAYFLVLQLRRTGCASRARTWPLQRACSISSGTAPAPARLPRSMSPSRRASVATQRRVDPAARPDPAAEHRNAGRCSSAARPLEVKVRGGSLNRLATPQASPGLPSELFPAPRSAVRPKRNWRRQFQRRRRARGFLSEHLRSPGRVATRARRCALLFTPQSAFYSDRRQSHAADL